MNEKIDMRDVFFNSLYEIISKDKNVIVLTADHGAFGLDQIRKDFPKQYINVGIAEQNMISVAAGLALSGKIVYVYSIINFVTLRCLEQINIDISSMNLHVNIIGVGAGFTYSTDGPTHHGVQDVAIMSCIPRMTIYNCSDANSTKYFANIGYLLPGPKYFRIEKGTVPNLYNAEYNSYVNGLEKLRSGSIIIISSGLMVHKALEVSNVFLQNNIEIGVIDLFRLKPINEELLVESISGAKCLIILEDNMSTGGLGEKVTSILYERNIFTTVSKLSIADAHSFIYSQDRSAVEAKFNLNVNSLVETVQKYL